MVLSIAPLPLLFKRGHKVLEGSVVAMLEKTHIKDGRTQPTPSKTLGRFPPIHTFVASSPVMTFTALRDRIISCLICTNFLDSSGVGEETKLTPDTASSSVHLPSSLGKTSRETKHHMSIITTLCKLGKPRNDASLSAASWDAIDCIERTRSKK